ncbi:MAG: pirin family protein [Oscillospiraceae bacterium]
MLRHLDKNNMGTSDQGWLRSVFHFSFAEYWNPDNIHFGVLRVINDDLVEPGEGFDLHPHKNMEIISYVVDGELTHQDSMGNKSTLSRGNVQYMSAGKGVFHSEHNRGAELLRFLQIWIVPDREGHTPQYGDHRFDWDSRRDKWLYIAGSKGSDAPIKINQDINVYATEITEGNSLDFEVKDGRQAYLVQIEGTSDINGLQIGTRDGLEITEEDITIKAVQTSHILILEMAEE